MTLKEFREITEHFPEDLAILCAHCTGGVVSYVEIDPPELDKVTRSGNYYDRSSDNDDSIDAILIF